IKRSTPRFLVSHRPWRSRASSRFYNSRTFDASIEELLLWRFLAFFSKQAQHCLSRGSADTYHASAERTYHVFTPCLLGAQDTGQRLAYAWLQQFELGQPDRAAVVEAQAIFAVGARLGDTERTQ